MNYESVAPDLICLSWSKTERAHKVRSSVKEASSLRRALNANFWVGASWENALQLIVLF